MASRQVGRGRKAADADKEFEALLRRAEQYLKASRPRSLKVVAQDKKRRASAA